MVRRDIYEDDAPSGPGGAFNLLRFVGHSRHKSTGFVGFAIKTFTVSACGAVVFGVSSYMLLGKHLGPTVPFMGGAAFGFLGGLVHRYRVDKEEAFIALERYPRVIEHHVALVESSELRNTPFDAWMADLRSSIRKQGVLVAALYSAADTLSKLQEEEEERLLERHYRGGAAEDE